MENDNKDQILNVIRYLTLKKVTPTRAAILDTESIKKWDNGEQIVDSVLDELVSDGLLVQSDEMYSLTPEGRKLAQPIDARGFGQWMIACEQSKAYRAFCRHLYGSDRCQFDMMTQIQLEKLLDVLKASNCQSILDMGCGTGALIYIGFVIRGIRNGKRQLGWEFSWGKILRIALLVLVPVVWWVFWHTDTVFSHILRARPENAVTVRILIPWPTTFISISLAVTLWFLASIFVTFVPKVKKKH
jgi:hypothetical protein